MKWGHPDILVWLWLLVPLAWLLLRQIRRREKLLSKLIDRSLWPHVIPDRKQSGIRRKQIVWLLALALCILALARPQWGFSWMEVSRKGLDVMVVLDTSNSMLAEDIKPNRLKQAQWGIEDLVRILNGDRIGLLCFAGGNFLQCPLTIDYAAFMMTLNDVYAGMIPRGGTAITPALNKAIDSFDSSSNADKAIVLITDGENHEGNPVSLLDKLKEKNIRVYSIGVGTREGELIPSTDDQQQGYLKDRQGRVVKTALNEAPLRELALGTGGIYVRSAPGDFGFDRIVRDGLSRLTKDEQESRMVKAYEDRFMWLAGAALLLFITEAFTTERNQRRGKQE